MLRIFVHFSINDEGYVVFARFSGKINRFLNKNSNKTEIR